MGSFLDAVRAEGREASDAAGELWQGAKNHDWKSSSKKRFQRKHWGWWLGAVVVLVLVVLLAIYRDTIVSKFEPHKDAITGKTWTWVVPIVLLIIISFPPLVSPNALVTAMEADEII
jgi:heme/copper-type cytochrome/quinol oxidase subunit 2